MPRWLRQFTFNKIEEHYKKEAEEHNKANKKSNASTLVDPSGKINKEAWKDVSRPIATSGPSKVKYK